MMHSGLVTHVVWVLLILVKFILSDQIAFLNWMLFGPNPIQPDLGISSGVRAQIAWYLDLQKGWVGWT